MTTTRKAFTILTALAALLIPLAASGSDLDVKAGVVERIPALRTRVNFCHRYYIKRGGDTEGKIRFSLRVNKSGKVEEVKITERTVQEDGFVECIKRAVKHTTYKVSRNTRIDLPLVFARVGEPVADLAANW